MNSARMNRRPRIVHRRMIIRGDLTLQTATHLGDGDSEGPTDMALLRDSFGSTKILLPGASIAGALRSYLREYLYGFCGEEQLDSRIQELFGGHKSDDEGYQSPLIVNDALATPLTYELRDGVKINGCTRTAADKAKYDVELIAAGTTFPLLFELAFVRQIDGEGKPLIQDEQDDYESKLLSGLATTLHGLACGEIALGMKKRRGFGQCAVSEWHVWDFDLTNHNDLFAWLTFDQSILSTIDDTHRIGTDITNLLGTAIESLPDQRAKVTLEATFELDGSMLIRSGQDAPILAPDVRHLHAYQPDKQSKPIVAGTSLAGVLRHRAERIANTLVNGSGTAFTNSLFGWVGASGGKTKDKGQASRLIVHEFVIEHVTDNLVQNRVSIDRFTGGALDGALFNEQPIFAKPETRLTLTLDVLNPQKGELAMLLLLLKDLWTGDLPIGGESSIGRGRLHGITATLKKNNTFIAQFSSDGKRVILAQGDRAALDTLIEQLPNVLQEIKDGTNGSA
ncbi:MAG: RAMP superfamily CRISPR-associated protein [Kouleothrix sp.]